MSVNQIGSTTSGQFQQVQQAKKRGETLPQYPDVSPATESERQTGEVASLTNPEKEYFAQLFPASADEIRTYNPYRQSGEKVAVKGTHVDRKG